MTVPDEANEPGGAARRSVPSAVRAERGRDAPRPSRGEGRPPERREGRERRGRGLARRLGKRLPWIAAAAFFVAMALWIGRDKRIGKEAYEAYSVHNTSEEGLSLAYRYLRERAQEEDSKAKVGVITRPARRAGISADAVLFQIRPSAQSLPEVLKRRSRKASPKKADGEAEGEGAEEGKEGKGGKGGKPEEDPEARGRDRDEGFLTTGEFGWAYDGGRLVLAIDESFREIDVKVARGDRAVSKVYPIWPGVEEVKPPAARRLSGEQTDRMHAIFAVGDGPLLGRWPVGRGEVFVMSCPEIFRNDRLAHGDHLALLEALAGAGRPVYFDEYVHGLQTSSGVMELFRSWGLGPLVILSALAAAIYFWRATARIGPEEDDHRETRTEAVEFVDSLAQLYNRALSRVEALALYEEAFKKSVTAVTGLRGKALDARIHEFTKDLEIPTNLSAALEVTAGRAKDMSALEFRRFLRGLNEAFRRVDNVKRQ